MVWKSVLASRRSKIGLRLARTAVQGCEFAMAAAISHTEIHRFGDWICGKPDALGVVRVAMCIS